eukprot:198326_1
MFAREFVYSYLLISMMWILMLFPKLFKFLPKIWTFEAKESLHHIPPPVPSTMCEAFQLGRFQQQLSIINNNTHHSDDTTSKIEQVLNRASAVFETNQKYRPKFTEQEQLNNLLQKIKEIENRKSVFQKIFGLFSFINILWFLSILGIIYSIFPVIYHSGKSVYDFLCEIFSGLIRELLQKIFVSRIAFETYEFLLYFIVFYIIFLAANIPRNHRYLTTSFYIAFTGVSSYFFVFYVSNFYINHTLTSYRMCKTDFTETMSWIFLLYSFLTMPLAIKFQSKLFAFMTVCGIYQYLGFYINAFYGGYVIGFNTKDDLENCIVVSLCLSITMIAIRLIHFHRIFNVFLSAQESKKRNQDKFKVVLFGGIKYFEMPLVIMSNIVLFLGLLIYCNNWVCYDYRDCNYWTAQTWMISALLISAFFGNYLCSPSMTSIAYVFTVLYVMSKSLEFEWLWRGKMVWYSMFITSVIYYKLALYLHANPAVIVNIFKW